MNENLKRLNRPESISQDEQSKVIGGSLSTPKSPLSSPAANQPFFECPLIFPLLLQMILPPGLTPQEIEEYRRHIDRGPMQRA
jgi:hypothetical protein